MIINTAVILGLVQSLGGCPSENRKQTAAKNSQQLVLYNLQLEITLIYTYFTCIIRYVNPEYQNNLPWSNFFQQAFNYIPMGTLSWGYNRTRLIKNNYLLLHRVSASYYTSS